MEIGDLRTETKKNKSESVFGGNILIKHSKKVFQIVVFIFNLQPSGSFPLSKHCQAILLLMVLSETVAMF